LPTSERRLAFALAFLTLLAGIWGLWPHVTLRFVPARLVVQTYAPEARPRVSLNRASRAELEALPGVGPALAERIIAHRPYLRIDDLLQVPGIGPRLFARIAPLVTP